MLMFFGIVIQRYASSSEQVVSVTAPLSEQESYWEGRVKAVGGTDAYAELQQFVAALSPGLQHQEAHIFGGALYKAEGVAGLTACDSQFSFGCFHEFMGRAIATLGLSVASSLAEGCFRSLGPERGISCQHGIGHGIEAAIGYDLNDLQKTLSLCDGLPYNDPIGGCYAGAFMEYNMQTMLGTEGRLRAANDADPYFPCDIVAEQYKKTCYFSQPQWWRQRAKEDGAADTAAAYEHVGVLCTRAPARFVRTCYEGIGTIVPVDADFNGSRARELCEDSADNGTHQLYCRSFAANALFVTSPNQETTEALSVCNGLTGRAYEYCGTYAENRANIMLPLDLP